MPANILDLPSKKEIKYLHARNVRLQIPVEEDLSRIFFPKTNSVTHVNDSKVQKPIDLVVIPNSNIYNHQTQLNSQFTFFPFQLNSDINDYSLFRLDTPVSLKETGLNEFDRDESNLMRFDHWFTEIENSETSHGLILKEACEESLKSMENIFAPLSSVRKVDGMLYSDRFWKSEKVPEYIRNTTKNPINSNRNSIRPKDFQMAATEKIPKAKYKPNIWDLIFVLLQPPLKYGEAGNFNLPHDLYPYQVVGVSFLIENHHALLADDMGTGKTVMTIVALRFLFQKNLIKKALILCPPSVIFQWKQHIEEWAPELISTIIRGPKDFRHHQWKIPTHVCITTYDTLRSDFDNEFLDKTARQDFNLVVVDEAHHIKNSSTQRSRTIRKVRADYYWALTGTPIQNKIDDLKTIFDFVHPGLLTQFDLYEERIKHKVAPFFLRRRKQDVLKDLPPKIRQDLWLELADDQRIEYNRAEREIILEVEAMGRLVTKQHIFAKIQRLKQICNFPTGKGISPKLDALKEQIEDISESGNKVIVFSQYIDQGVQKIGSALKPYGISVIEGGQNDSIRKIEIEKFINSEKTKILIASLRTGGEGLNLQVASYVIHFDHWWNPATMWQAEDRVHRSGQKQRVNIYSYWMKDTIDERIYQILKKKGILIENVVEGLSEQEIDASFTNNDLLDILGAKKISNEKKVFSFNKYSNFSLEQIQNQLKEIPADEFELLIEEMMHYLGYPNLKITQRSHDGGIDVISTRTTEKGIERVAAQCKRYKRTIGVQIARDFLGAIRNNDSISKGIIFTTSDFSRECIEFCIRNKIQMVPGLKIADYIKQFGLEIQNIDTKSQL